MSSARSASSTIWKFLLGVLVALLVLLLVAEFGLRWFVGDRLRSTFEEQAAQDGVTLQEDPTIAFGASPLVLSAVRGMIPEVEITTPETLQISGQDVSGQPGAHVVLTDLDISDTDNPVAGHMTATSEVPVEFLLATIRNSIAEGGGAGSFIEVTDLTAHPAEGTLELAFNNGAASLDLIPRPVDGTLTFEAAGASLFGFPLPGQVSDLITRGLRDGVSDQAGNFDIDAFDIIDGGARLQLSGENVHLNELGETPPQGR